MKLLINLLIDWRIVFSNLFYKVRKENLIIMFEWSKKNKIESAVIIGIFILVITLIVYYVCNALDLGSFSIVIALIVSIATSWGSYYYSDKIVLSLNRARPATKEEDLKLVNILDSLMVASRTSC